MLSRAKNGQFCVTVGPVTRTVSKFQSVYTTGMSSLATDLGLAESSSSSVGQFGCSFRPFWTWTMGCFGHFLILRHFCGDGGGVRVYGEGGTGGQLPKCLSTCLLQSSQLISCTRGMQSKYRVGQIKRRHFTFLLVTN